MKTLRNTSIITLAIVALALLMAPMAMANTVIVVGSTISDSTAVTPSMGSMYVGGFYSAPGIVGSDTLTGVEIILSGEGTTSMYVSLGINIDDPPVDGTHGSVLISDFTNTTTLTLSGLTPPLILSGTEDAGNYLLATVAPTTVYDHSGTFNVLPGYVDEYPANISDYAISGNIYYTLSGTAVNGADFSNLTNQFAEGAGGTTLAGASVEAIYTYDNGGVVPEPGTLSLFGTGLLGLAGMLRHRFMKSR
ncbi:MAG: PEP-CTERM sorting domain-containing protein [Terracidiphilus sp.]|jgi:hypothetical protein